MGPQSPTCSGAAVAGAASAAAVATAVAAAVAADAAAATAAVGVAAAAAAAAGSSWRAGCSGYGDLPVAKRAQLYCSVPPLPSPPPCQPRIPMNRSLQSRETSRLGFIYRVQLMRHFL